MLPTDSKKKLTLILQTIQSKDEMLIRSALFNFSKLIQNNDNIIHEYHSLSPNFIELFDDSVHQLVIKNIHLSTLWLKLINLILQKLKTQPLSSSCVHDIIDKLLSLSSKHKAIIINLRNDKQIDSENIVIQLMNTVASISNPSLKLLIASLSLHDYSSWHSFWTRCKHHALSQRTKLGSHLFHNCYHFAVLLLSTNNPQIVSMMIDNKPFWTVIKSLIEKNHKDKKKNTIFTYILEYFDHHKLTLNNNKLNLQFLEFWLFVLLDIDHKPVLTKLFDTINHIKNIYVHLSTFLLKISADPNYIELLITFFKANDNAERILSFIQKRSWHISDDVMFFDEISLLNDLYKILDASQVELTPLCIPTSLTVDVLITKLEYRNIIVSFSAIHLLHWWITHGITNIMPPMKALMGIFDSFNHSDNKYISIEKYHTLLTQLMIQCLTLNICTVNEDINHLWALVTNETTQCRSDVWMEFITELNKKCLIWNHDQYIHILHATIGLWMHEQDAISKAKMIDFMSNVVLPAHKTWIRSEFASLLSCIALDNNGDDASIALIVLLLCHFKFETHESWAIYQQIRTRFPRYSLFVYVLYVISISDTAEMYTNTTWFTHWYHIHDQWFRFNHTLRLEENMKTIETFFASQFKLQCPTFKLNGNAPSLQSILNSNMKQKYYFGNMYSLFIDVCKLKKKDMHQMEKHSHIVDTCCAYLDGIAPYLTSDELRTLLPLLSIKLFEQSKRNDNTLYFNLLSSILKSIYKHHSSNTEWMEQIKDALNMKQSRLHHEVECVPGLLYYVENSIITQMIHNLIHKKQHRKLGMMIQYICDDTTFEGRYVAQFVDKLYENKDLNQWYWCLCERIVNGNNNKQNIHIVKALVSRMDIQSIIHRNKQNTSIILEMLSFVSVPGELQEQHLKIFIQILKVKDYNFVNKAFFEFLNERILNLNYQSNLGPLMANILLFILRLNKQIKWAQNQTAMHQMYLHTVCECFNKLFTNDCSRIDAQLLHKLDGILLNHHLFNTSYFWKFLCDLCDIETTNDAFKDYVKSYLLKTKKKYCTILSDNAQTVDIKGYIVKMVNQFQIKLHGNLIHNLCKELDGIKHAFNTELLKLMQWNDVTHVLLSRYASNDRKKKKKNDAENVIVSWFNHLNGDILKCGPSAGANVYDIDFIWMSFVEILKRENKMICSILVKKTISSKLMDYILIGMTANDVLIRQKCYGLFEVFFKLICVMKADSAIYYKWYFIVETLRLSIKEKYERLPDAFVDFIICSMHISANPLHSEYSMICDSFCTRTMINTKQLPLQHRILLTHFVDIEKHKEMTCYKYKQSRNKYLNNRIISLRKT